MCLKTSRIKQAMVAKWFCIIRGRKYFLMFAEILFCEFFWGSQGNQNFFLGFRVWFMILESNEGFYVCFMGFKWQASNGNLLCKSLEVKKLFDCQ
jgi:hypothetical protein